MRMWTSRVRWQQAKPTLLGERVERRWHGQCQVATNQGRSQDLELVGAVLLLTICSGFGFWLYCLASKGFIFLFFILCVCRACLLLIRTKLFCLKFFKGLSCLFLVKLVDQSQFIYLFIFNLCYCLLVIFVGGLIFWACIHILKDFRSINFFMDFKRMKILSLQIFLQIFVVISGYQ